MDIRSSWRNLSLAAILLAGLISGCTETAYVRMQLVYNSSKAVLLEEIEGVASARGWKREGEVLVLDSSPSLYLRIEKQATRDWTISLVVVGSKVFDTNDKQVFQDLVSDMRRRFGNDFKFEEISNAGQSLKMG